MASCLGEAGAPKHAAREMVALLDLYELRRNGVAAAITRAHREGATVMGICGGYQMMGQEVLDPEHVEGDIERLPGLGLLPISTRMSVEKVTRQVKFGLCNPHSPSSTLRSPFMQGYEIHMGVTTPVEGAPDSPLNLLENGSTDGYYVDSTCMGHHVIGDVLLALAARVDRL